MGAGVGVDKAAMVASTSAATVAGKSGVAAGVVATSASELGSGKGVSAAPLQATATTLSSVSTPRRKLFGIDRTIPAEYPAPPPTQIMAKGTYQLTMWQLLKTKRLTVEQYQELLDGKFDDSNPGWENSKACLINFISLARTQSIQTVVIPFPVPDGLDQEPYAYQGYISAICDVARAEGVDCLDVVPALRDQRIHLTVSSVESHPSAAIYGRVAERVANLLP